MEPEGSLHTRKTNNFQTSAVLYVQAYIQHKPEIMSVGRGKVGRNTTWVPC